MTGDDRPPAATAPPAADDWRALGDLIALTVERLTAPVEGMHHAIADRWFGFAGTGGAPVHLAHRAATAGVYGSVRLAGSIVGSLAGLGARVAGHRYDVPALWSSLRGNGLRSSVNALWGDELAARGSGLAIDLGVVDVSGAPIAVEPASLASAHPAATGRVAVLIHGLGESERRWVKAVDPDGRPGLVAALQADSFTPVFVRYNTGRHVFENGVELSALLEEVIQNWPVPVEEVVLVGHSMGGLVGRSALHAAGVAGHAWLDRVGHVVALGSPHLGAPLEKGTNLVSWVLKLVAETRPLGDFLDRRSAGIKDLRYGAVREDDWHGTERDALLHDVVGEAVVPEHVHQHFVAGVVTADPAHPLGILAGDLMVRLSSSTGRGRGRRVEATNVHVVAGRRHFDLLDDPAVHEQVRAWLSPKR